MTNLQRIRRATSNRTQVERRSLRRRPTRALTLERLEERVVQTTSAGSWFDNYAYEPVASFDPQQEQYGYTTLNDASVGYSYAESQGGKLVEAGAYGDARSQSQGDTPTTPMTPDTLLTVGSISKTITDAALLHMIDESGGAITLDTPFYGLIKDDPHFKGITVAADVEKITLRDLMLMASGMDNPSEADPQPVIGSWDAMETWLRQTPTPGAVGNEYVYKGGDEAMERVVIQDNNNYNLPYEQYVKQMLAPLGITQTSITDAWVGLYPGPKFKGSRTDVAYYHGATRVFDFNQSGVTNPSVDGDGDAVNGAQYLGSLASSSASAQSLRYFAPAGWTVELFTGSDGRGNMLKYIGDGQMHELSTLPPGWNQSIKSVEFLPPSEFHPTLYYALGNHSDGQEISEESSWRSTADELLKFADGLRYGKILSDSSWGEMATITTATSAAFPNNAINGALGLFPGTVGSVEYLIKTGGYSVQSSSGVPYGANSGLVMFDDADGTDIVFLSNTNLDQDPGVFLPQGLYPVLENENYSKAPYIDLYSDGNFSGDETELRGSLGGKNVPLVDQAYETTSSYQYYLPTGWSARLLYNLSALSSGFELAQTIVGDDQEHSVSRLGGNSFLGGLLNDTLVSIQFVPPPSLPLPFQLGPVEDSLQVGSDGSGQGSLIPLAVDAVLADLAPVVDAPGKHPNRRSGMVSS